MIYIVLEIIPQNIQKNELFNAILLLIVAKENNTIKKWGTDLKTEFSAEESQMAKDI